MAQNVIPGCFEDNRAGEFIEAIEDVIHNKGSELGLTYATIIGILQSLIIDLHNESRNI